jgi:hypothetical protein
MKRIDKPIDAALSNYDADQENRPLEITCKIGAEVFNFVLPLGPFNPLSLLNSLREQFSVSARFGRIRELLSVLKSEIDSLQRESAENSTRLGAFEAEQTSPEYAEAFRVAAEEAVRTADAKRIERLGIALANGLDPDVKALEADGLSTFIRDLSQLSELDIRTLETIINTPRFAASLDTWAVDSTLGQRLVVAAVSANLEKNDFYSHAYRLVGFGLALEAPSESGRRTADNLCFVPTRRGRKLLALLQSRASENARQG